MKEINCQDVRRKIEEAELDQYLSEESAAHLCACEACRAFHDERSALRHLVGSLGMVSAPADFDFRLRARLASSRNAGRRLSFKGFLRAPSPRAITVAASFALLVTAAAIYKQAGYAPPRDSTRTELAAAPASLSTANSAGEQHDKVQSNTGTQRATAAPQSAASVPQNLLAASRSRNRSPKSVKFGEERNAPAAPVAAGPGINSVDSVGRAAQVISLVAVRVPVTSQPVKVSLEDRRGAKRTISLQPVTFGSQELIERKGASRVSTVPAKKIW